jgi:hypothetical protein
MIKNKNNVSSNELIQYTNFKLLFDAMFDKCLPGGITTTPPHTVASDLNGKSNGADQEP